MSACYGADGNLNNRLSLDPLTLYPFWKFRFYFNETIAGNEGIEVGVLGDTGAIFSSGGFGYLGGGNPTTANGTPTITSATNNSLDLVLIAAATTALILIVSVPIALRRKIRQRK